MRNHRLLLTSSTLIALVSASACGGDDDGTAATSGEPETTVPQTTGPPATAVIDPGDDGKYRPDVDPANFVAVIDNPYFPLQVGSRWVYEGESDGESERNVIKVTDRDKTVMGIDATVVRDTVFVGDELTEDTFDWFAQDRDGNVWYLGEDTKELEGGKVVSTEGSWEGGVDGALPGIVMPATPKAGDAFRQEYDAGEAEDMFQIADLGGTVKVPAGRFEDVVTTKDWTPLEPEQVEHKQYAPGVGKIKEELVAGGDEVAELVEYSLPG
jgi:hypothetical protein